MVVPGRVDATCCTRKGEEACSTRGRSRARRWSRGGTRKQSWRFTFRPVPIHARAELPAAGNRAQSEASCGIARPRNPHCSATRKRLVPRLRAGLTRSIGLMMEVTRIRWFNAFLVLRPSPFCYPREYAGTVLRGVQYCLENWICLGTGRFQLWNRVIYSA